MYDQEPWCTADVFFLSDAVRRGMPLEEVAGFLGRSMEEVIEKAKALRISVTEEGPESNQPRKRRSGNKANTEVGF